MERSEREKNEAKMTVAQERIEKQLYGRGKAATERGKKWRGVGKLLKTTAYDLQTWETETNRGKEMKGDGGRMGEKEK